MATPQLVATKRLLHFVEAVLQGLKRVDVAGRKQLASDAGELASVRSNVKDGPNRHQAKPAIRRNPVDIDAEASDGSVNRPAELLGEADRSIVPAHLSSLSNDSLCLLMQRNFTSAG